MSVFEQQELREKYYGEAIRYMSNAKEYLKNAKKEGSVYRNPFDEAHKIIEKIKPLSAA